MVRVSATSHGVVVDAAFQVIRRTVGKRPGSCLGVKLAHGTFSLIYCAAGLGFSVWGFYILCSLVHLVFTLRYYLYDWRVLCLWISSRFLATTLFCRCITWVLFRQEIWAWKPKEENIIILVLTRTASLHRFVQLGFCVKNVLLNFLKCILEERLQLLSGKIPENITKYAVPWFV